METQIYLNFIGIISPFVIGIIIFFIKRIMSNHDKHGEKIADIEKNYVKKDELEEKQRELKNEIKEEIREQVSNIKEDIKEMKIEFNDTNNKTLKAINEMNTQINDIKLNYVSTADFIRSNASLSAKMDKMMEMLIEEKTKNASKN